eukprot:TRINITY_DN47978_c0_g1_i1.p1 TRINITY_DN47978_c0_g1~~TRINITY_DN47978_c0_g1_i1.p1  ORF type:complete len:162 (+),score=45.28 TRINITY_DN47978_c0_g1_i1:72-488(+)
MEELGEAQQKAVAYLEKHQLPQLIQSLMARAVLERPEDLQAFLIERLQELKAMRSTNPGMGLFDQEDLKTMFDMWDDQKVGAIPAEKILETLKAVNCTISEEKLASRPWSQLEEVDKESFVKYVRNELEMASAAMLSG